MTIQITFNEQDQIIEVKVRELFDWSVIETVVPQVSVFVNEKNCHRILLDFRSAHISLSTIQIYMTPEKLSDEFKKFGVEILLLRRALLLKQNDSDYQFLETVVLNKSQILRIFFDETAAREWLKA